MHNVCVCVYVCVCVCVLCVPQAVLDSRDAELEGCRQHIAQLEVLLQSVQSDKTSVLQISKVPGTSVIINTNIWRTGVKVK